MSNIQGTLTILTNSYLLLLSGILCAAIGGELFVRGVVGIARWARVSAGIIGATFAAFATSGPEMSVSVSSSLAGAPQIGLGDALGSNVVNIALILGLALVIAPVIAPRDILRRDYSMALLVPPLLGLLAWDGILSRVDGFILLALFAVWLATVVREVRRQRSVAGVMLGEARHGLAILSSMAGLVFLVASGKLIVTGANGIALIYGIDAFVIGATLVAVGTSAPELATVIIAKLRGHDEVGLGTLLGSNIFNGLLIVGVAASIHPISISHEEMSTGLTMGMLVTAIVFPGHGRVLGRMRGWVLLTTYAVYLGLIMRGGTA